MILAFLAAVLCGFVRLARSETANTPQKPGFRPISTFWGVKQLFDLHLPHKPAVTCAHILTAGGQQMLRRVEQRRSRGQHFRKGLQHLFRLLTSVRGALQRC
jgi:hypothetical protein